MIKELYYFGPSKIWGKIRNNF